jgi:translation initiation factor IF-2
LTGNNVDKLIETIILVSEVNSFKANPNRLALGIVIETGFETGKGNSATVIVQNGTLHKGDFVIAGSSFGRVKMMFNDLKKEVNEVLPSQPAKIFGLNKAPVSGQKFIVSKDERKMKEFATKVNEIEKDTYVAPHFDDSSIKFNIIIKADVYGSLEAITNMIEKIEVNGTKPFIVKSSIGVITENDVIIAKLSKSIIFGFNVKPTKMINEYAASNDVKILFYDIIYRLQDDLVKMIEGTLNPVVVEEETGEATIQQI